MERVDVHTRTAAAMNYAVACPVVLNLDTMQKFFQMSEDYLSSPVILRINANHFDLGDYAHFAEYYSKKYPKAVVSIMAAHVRTYEEACLACRYSYNGVALDDSIKLDDRKSRKLIEMVARVCQASNCALQVTVGDPEYLLKKSTCEFLRKNCITLVRYNLDKKVTDKNVQKLADLFLQIKQVCPADLCLNDMSNVDVKFYENFKWSGVAKFDLFAVPSEKAAAACMEAYENEPNKNSRGILPDMRRGLFDVYVNDIGSRMTNIGNFVNKHALPPALMK